MNDFTAPEFLECVRFSRTPIEYETPKRDFCVLSYRLFGEAAFYHDDRKYLVNNSNVLFLPANIKYSQSCNNEELICVHFKCCTNIFSDKITVYSFQNILQIKEMFCDLYDAYSKPGISSMLKARALFYELCCLLCRKERESDESVVAPSIRYINENYRNINITVKEIAAVSNISEVYFRKKFALEYNKTPIQYINEQRIKYACALLRGRYLSLEEVAVQSGFDNSKYFSRVFSNFMGISPGKYAKLK